MVGFTVEGESMIIINCPDQKSAHALNSLLADIIAVGGITCTKADEPK